MENWTDNLLNALAAMKIFELSITHSMKIGHLPKELGGL
jgi:hypothetical protein